MDFSEILRTLRTQAGITQKQLGQILGLSTSTVCDWERKRSEPSLTQLKNLATALFVSTDFLLGIKEEC